jgi:hypothetical protein
LLLPVVIILSLSFGARLMRSLLGGVWARQSPSRDLPEYYFDHGSDRLLAIAAPMKKGLGVPARLEFGCWAAQENKVSHKLRLNPALLRITESYTYFFHLQRERPRGRQKATNASKKKDSAGDLHRM